MQQNAAECKICFCPPPSTLLINKKPWSGVCCQQHFHCFTDDVLTHLPDEVWSASYVNVYRCQLFIAAALAILLRRPRHLNTEDLVRDPRTVVAKSIQTRNQSHVAMCRIQTINVVTALSLATSTAGKESRLVQIILDGLNESKISD